MSTAATTPTTAATRLFADKTPTTFLKPPPLFKPQPKTPSFSTTYKNPCKISSKNPISEVISSFQSHPDDKASTFNNKVSIFNNSDDIPQLKTPSFPKTHKNPSKISSKNPISDVISSFQSHPDDKNSIFNNKASTFNNKVSIFNNSEYKPELKTPSFPKTHKNPSKISSKNPISDVISSFNSYPDDKDSTFNISDDKPREECGVVGIFGDTEASRLCYLALHALQHRGQEGAGIVAATPDGVLKSITGVGLVSEVFNQSKLDQLPGDNAIGHVRYSTAGQSMLKNVQPFVAGYRFGRVGVAHNGNLVNYQTLRAELEDNGSIFGTSSDTEVVLHLIAISKQRPFFLRIVEACEKLKGAYSMVFLTEDKLVAVRDPFGFRPLVMGRRGNGAVVFASETCALDLIEATYEREVNPGEVLIVDKDGVQSLCLMPHPEPKSCVFEHIYFSLPNSVVFGKSVYESRRRFGEILATESPVECDVVIAVPDSGVVAAIGYANEAGVPFQQGLIRSHYVGRTFIEPSQRIRDFGVKLKLSPVRAVLEGKRVVVVDDSIVRGTTSSKIVRLLKEAGAKEVHMRIASPPIIASCYYGVDTPSSEELISNRMSVEEIREFIGCDSLAFLKIDSLKKMLASDSPNFCYACFSGDYPVLPSGKVKRVGDFVDDGLNGSIDSIDGGWLQGSKEQQNEKDLDVNYEEQDGKVPV